LFLPSFETLLGGVTGAGPTETVAIKLLTESFAVSTGRGLVFTIVNTALGGSVLGCNDKFGVRAKVLRVATHISYTRKVPHGAQNSNNSPRWKYGGRSGQQFFLEETTRYKIVQKSVSKILKKVLIQ
jgi:hypothetical protein